MTAEDISSTCTYTICEAGSALKRVLIETVATADSTDTISLTLATYGISDLQTVRGTAETTVNSVFAAEAPTTTITSGVLEITVGGSTVSNKKRNYILEGR